MSVVEPTQCTSRHPVWNDRCQLEFGHQGDHWHPSGETRWPNNGRAVFRDQRTRSRHRDARQWGFTNGKASQ